jgi:molybdopterin-guanine dinucleotide biosynthesis protein MobB
MPIIAVVGSRQSGKTTTVEALVKGLTQKGYRVATAKHIPEKDFTMDTKGKDTWKHAQAGAKTILSVAPNELTIIKKEDTTKYNLNHIVKILEKEEVDILILEGFRNLVAKDLTVPKIVTAKTSQEILETSKYFKPVMAFTTPTKLSAKESKIPMINALKEPEKLIEIVEPRVGPIIKKRRALRQTLTIQVNQKTLLLNPFVQKFVRNVILSMISTLKETTITGQENISIEIEQPKAP